MSEWKYFFLFGFDVRELDYIFGKVKRRNFKVEKKRLLLFWFVLDLLGLEVFFFYDFVGEFKVLYDILKEII